VIRRAAVRCLDYGADRWATATVLACVALVVLTFPVGVWVALYLLARYDETERELQFLKSKENSYG